MATRKGLQPAVAAAARGGVTAIDLRASQPATVVYSSKTENCVVELLGATALLFFSLPSFFFSTWLAGKTCITTTTFQRERDGSALQRFLAQGWAGGGNRGLVGTFTSKAREKP